MLRGNVRAVLELRASLRPLRRCMRAPARRRPRGGTSSRLRRARERCWLRCPPRIVPMLTVVSPRIGSVGSASVAIVGSSSSIGSIADSPRCAYAECASRPRVRTVTRSDPLAPLASLLSVGSPLTRNRLVAGRRLAARAPSDPFSSPTTKSRSTRCLAGVGESSAATSIAAAMPFASHAPRPYSLSPSSRGAMYGGTVSRCVESVTPPPARDAQTLRASRATSCIVTFQPRAMSHFETKSTAPLSAPVDESNGEELGSERDDVGHSARVAEGEENTPQHPGSSVVRRYSNQRRVAGNRRPSSAALEHGRAAARLRLHAPAPRTSAGRACLRRDCRRRDAAHPPRRSSELDVIPSARPAVAERLECVLGLP